MNQILEWLSRIFQSWKFWIVVPPWDVGIRIRLGKKAATLQPGPHLRIPFLDEVTLVNTRLRILAAPAVTIAGTEPSKTKSIVTAVGYSIVDPVLAMLSYTNPEPAISAFAQAEIARSGVAAQAECLAALRTEFKPHGIDIAFLYFVENVEVRTLRILQGNSFAMFSNGTSAGPVPPGTVGSY